MGLRFQSLRHSTDVARVATIERKQANNRNDQLPTPMSQASLKRHSSPKI